MTKQLIHTVTCLMIQNETKLLQKNMIDDLIERVGKLEHNQGQIQPKLTNMKNDITDLQCRSIRDNLIFTGIQELESTGQAEIFDVQPDSENSDIRENRENVEETLIKFLKDEMDIDHKIEFHRVHRIFIPDKTDGYPNPIVAKFVNLKDREYVRMQAP